MNKCSGRDIKINRPGDLTLGISSSSQGDRNIYKQYQNNLIKAAMTAWTKLLAIIGRPKEFRLRIGVILSRRRSRREDAEKGFIKELSCGLILEGWLRKSPEREERNVFLEEEEWHVLFALICTLKSKVPTSLCQTKQTDVLQ